MNITRKSFLLGAAGAAFVPTALCAESEDWREAFRSVGFDPEAEGSSYFVLTADIHTTRYHQRLAEHVAFWNSMIPRPVFVGALGDLAYVNERYGDRLPRERAEANAAEQFGAINDILTNKLDKRIRRVYVVGNHDTYIGEDDRALWHKYFPDQPTYCAFDLCGLRFIKWDGGVDGMFSAEQEKWILSECKKCPKDKQIVVLVHQPSVGKCGQERDIGRVAKAALADRPGVTWMLSGHDHGNVFRKWDLAGGGTLAVVTHTMDRWGWWAYGVRDGRIVARIYKANDVAKFVPYPMPESYASRGEIPLAFQGRTDVVWKTFVGDPEEKACRVELKQTQECCTFLFWVGTTLYKFPKGRVAPAATRYAILGSLVGERDTKKPAKCLLSADGVNWTHVSRTAVKDELNEFPIPPELVGAETLWVRYESFGYGCDEGHAGYAFLT